MHEALFRYWGKAAKSTDATAPVAYHLLACHSLDVAAFAAAWWEASKPLRQRLCLATGEDARRTQAWLLFFIALHDYGKLDIRFQSLAPQLLRQLQPDFEPEMVERDRYRHGPGGYHWFVEDSKALGLDDEAFDRWHPWMEAVAGHHGSLQRDSTFTHPEAEVYLIEQDSAARWALLQLFERIFLQPADLSLASLPPALPDLVAGLCSICDWSASDRDRFPYQRPASNTLDSLIDYYRARCQLAKTVFGNSGLWQQPLPEGGMAALFPDYQPRQVQLLVDSIPRSPGVTLIEAPTGSGKSEAALAYAAHLLVAGQAESIIFALPTQATANAMYSRLEEITPRLFPAGAHLLLAHGRSKYHPRFNAMSTRAGDTAQGEEEALFEAVQWLGASRKRAFLGQVGVCTIDQAFLSVLPVRHQFVRAFGLRKAVLIIDEVHAYDAYMYGLLVTLIQGQRAAGGSTILLSATLPAWQKALLLGAEMAVQPDTPYPLVSHLPYQGASPFILTNADDDKPPRRTVSISCQPWDNGLPAAPLSDKIIKGAREGARVAVICNLVADAQQLFQSLRAQSEKREIEIDLFHSRYRFADRQQREQAVMAHYGPAAERPRGRILVATQVVEQSLDLDFDWMVTQLCPVDLLFQRLGRLHRHPLSRPAGFDSASCTVLIPTAPDYGLHRLIYGYQRLLWRTQQRLQQVSVIQFPEAYRDWIESIYAQQPWPDEPDAITAEAERFLLDQEGRFYGARRMAHRNAKPLPDTDAGAARLTRDGEMSLTIQPFFYDGGVRRLFDGEPVDTLKSGQRSERLDLNGVPAPESWCKYLGNADEEGYFWLEMRPQEPQEWVCEQEGQRFTYSEQRGLEKS